MPRPHRVAEPPAEPSVVGRLTPESDAATTAVRCPACGHPMPGVSVDAHALAPTTGAGYVVTVRCGRKLVATEPLRIARPAHYGRHCGARVALWLVGGVVEARVA